MHKHRQCGRINKHVAAAETLPITYKEFIRLVVGNENSHNVGQLFDILRFLPLTQAKEENLGSSTARPMTV